MDREQPVFQHVEPQDFLQRAPDRIMGTETELDLQFHRWSPDAPHDHTVGYAAYHFISRQALTAIGQTAMVLQPNLSTVNAWLANGSRLYQDLSFLETCTPESAGPAQLTAAELAGRSVASQMVAASGLSHRGLYLRTGSGFGYGQTNGYHRNLLVPASLLQDPTSLAALTGHLATAVWSRTGLVGPDGYEWSQKHRGIGAAVSTDLEDRVARSRKPILLLRSLSLNDDSDVNPDDRWGRIEDRSADAAHNPQALFIAHASNSIVTRLVEHQAKAAADIAPPVLADPVQALHATSVDPHGIGQQLELADGRTISHQAMQYSLHEAASKLAGRIELPADEQIGLALWEQAVDRQHNWATSREVDAFATICEAARKLRVLRRHYDDAELAGNHQAHMIDLLYDRLDAFGANRPTPGAGQRLTTEPWSPYHQTDWAATSAADVEQLMSNPPQTSRAWQRGSFIADYGDNPLPYFMYWSKAGGAPGNHRGKRWDDPYGNL